MSRPNLVFIYTDEQAYQTLAAYGNRKIQMPNLNRLAEESVVFDQVYVSQAVCTPSRSTLLTGLYPHTNGCTENNIPLRIETACLPEMIEKEDYVTAHHGKWHLGDEIFAQHGFGEWVSLEDAYRAYHRDDRDSNARSSYHRFLIERGFSPKNGNTFGRGEAARLPEQFGKPAFLGREASRFIRENRGRPFILYVNFLEPHMPYYGPRDDQHDPAEVTVPANFNHPPTEQQPLKARILQQAYSERGFEGRPLKTEADWRRMIANYWGLCSLVDTHAGRILDTIDECGLRDSTIVVFTSDHGDMMGSHRLLAKCVQFEEAVRVPMLIRLPGQKDGRRIKGPVSQIDLVPTLLDLMGQPLPDHLQGKSLKPALDRDGEQNEDVFIEWNGPNSGVVGESRGRFWVPKGLGDKVSPEEAQAAICDPVRTLVTPDGWKFNCSPIGEHELYDLKEDPIEVNNLAATCTPTVRDLRDRIRTWQDRTGDEVELPELKG